MAAILNGIMKTYLRKRFKRIEAMRNNSIELQNQLLSHLIRKAAKTEWGSQYGYRSIGNEEEFKIRVPLQDYESHQPYIQRMMDGESDLLWPGKTKLFAKSSGTTSNRSKFIPVTKESLRQCLVPSGWDALSIYYDQRPDAQLFCSPSQETALLPEWEEKIKAIARECIYENITMMSGVPTWNIILFKKILDLTGMDNIHDVWPQLSLYLHGGVSFDPYKNQFSDYLPKHMDYLEVYNASEGYFGVQDILGRDDMLLMTDNGIYYEFIQTSDLDQKNPTSLSLKDVELDVNYAVVISSSTGLWRYVIGDTVQFSSVMPYRIRITGRTKQFINVFGEEVIVSNTDRAIAEAAAQCYASIIDYTVAPIQLNIHQKGGHHWLIEFEHAPNDMNTFTKCLDKKLQDYNADYAAKRYKSMALACPVIDVLPRGTFKNWLKSKGKLGAQHKVPRLSNSREFIDDILKLREKSTLYV